LTSATDHLQPLLAKLTLEEKVSLIQGADFWTTVPLPSIGLRAMTLSDGPAGVRGPRWDEREPSLNLPSGSALGASWDVELAYRYGAAAASEARRKDVDVVLGPTINLHRSPLGGRHFECFSEDPELSAELGAAYVVGLQDNGVAATPKHYVANDSETDRFTVDARVGDRALRELYLLAFEKAVTEARAWLVMSSYNSVNGVTVTDPSRAPTRSASSSSLSTLRSRSASLTRPSRTASTRCAHAGAGPGIARSCEAGIESRLRTAVQSEITTPSKPHSELSGCSSRSCSVIVTP
jgi:beta-glucosidase